MSRLPDKQIEDMICEGIYRTLTNEDFHQFYINEDEKSLVAHISCDDNCPTIEEILTLIRKKCFHIVNSAKDIAAHACQNTD